MATSRAYIGPCKGSWQFYKQFSTVLAIPEILSFALQFISFTAIDEFAAVVIDNGSGTCKSGCNFSIPPSCCTSLTVVRAVAGDDEPHIMQSSRRHLAISLDSLFDVVSAEPLICRSSPSP